MGAFCLVAILSACDSTDIDLNEYLNIEYIGYDGYGQAIATIDFKQLATDHSGDINVDEKPSGLSNEDYLTVALSDHVVTSVDTYTGLSNGDDIHIEWSMENQETIEDALGVTFAYESVTEEVVGLPAVVSFDAFEDIEVVFGGVSPSGTAEIDASRSSIDPVQFTLDNDSNLKNGDVVTVTLNNEYIDSLASDDGRMPMESTKIYVVDGLPEYATKLSELTDDVFTTVNTQGKQTIEESILESWDEPERYDSMLLLGYYFLSSKDVSTERSDENRLIVAFQVNTDDNFAYYSYIEFYDLLRLDDGTISFDEDRIVIPESGEGNLFEHDGNHYFGYPSLEELFEDKVNSQLGEYIFETNIY